MATQPNYLAGVGLADPEDDEEQYDPDAEFTQDQQNAQVPQLIAGGAPPGYIIGGDQAPPVPPPASAARPRSESRYPAFRIKGSAEQPVAIGVPDYMPSPQAISPDDSGYAPASTRPLNTDLPIADLPAPFANRVIGKDTTLQGAQETARQIAAQQPIRPEPKWWNRAAAGALGAAAGYSNAARRAAPIDIQKTTEGIMYPGYEGKLASWQSRVNAANQQVQDLGQEVASQYAGQKIQSEAQLKAAQSAAAMAHGQYWVSRSEQERTQWRIDPKSGELYNTISGQIAARPPTAQDRMQTALALLTASKDPDAQSKAAYYALNGKLPPPVAAKIPPDSTTALAIRSTGRVTGNPQIDAMDPKEAKAAIDASKDRDPLRDTLAQEIADRRKQQDLDGIDQKQIADENRVTQQRETDLRGVQSNQNMLDADKQIAIARINGNAAAQLQAIKDTTAAQRSRRGLQVQNYDVKVGPEGNPVYVPRVAPPADAQAPTPQQRLPIAPPVTPPVAPRPTIGQAVTVDSKPAIVIGINPGTGKPIVRFQ